MEDHTQEVGKQKQPNRKIMWSVLPSEIEENILSRLPGKTLKRCSCICKHWCNLVTTPHFIKMQLSRLTQINALPKVVFATFDKVYFVDVEAWKNQSFKARGHENIKTELAFNGGKKKECFKVVGSCNGLLCLSPPPDVESLYLLNPATNEHIRLPYPPYLFAPQLTGFGYIPRTDEYKVMIIEKIRNEHVVYVYTLGRDSSWRSIGHIEYRIEYPYHQALVNGALHWMASGIPGFPIVPISFDLEDEKFRELSLPKSFSKEDVSQPMGLVELGGFLSLYHWKEVEKFDIWAMKDYGDERSWTKVFSAAQPILSMIRKSFPLPRRSQLQGLDAYGDGQWSRIRRLLTPLYILKKDEVVLCENDYGFFILDAVKKQIHTLKLKHETYYSVTVTHLESLVSLRAIGEMDRGNK